MVAQADLFTNHRRAMAKREESLKLEIKRRHAPNAAGANLQPPAPTFPHSLTYRKKLQQQANVAPA